jgi:hypothetical protein
MSLLAHRMAEAPTAPAGVHAADFDALLAGARPTPVMLRRLAPGLGLHAADLFVIAGLDLPDDLVAARTKPWEVGSVLNLAARLTPQSRRRVHEAIRSMPARPPVHPTPQDRLDQVPGPWGMLLRLLRNRNISPYTPVILVVAGGPNLSYSTVATIARGGEVLTSRHVASFAAVLGIPADDLAAITGVEQPTKTPWLHPDWAELTGLAWDARRLSSDQVSQVERLAYDLSRADPDEYCLGCHRYHTKHLHWTSGPRRRTRKAQPTAPPAGHVEAAADGSDQSPLRSLLAHRRAAAPGALGGAHASEFDAILTGTEPTAAMLRRLAPALGLHAADLFVIAGLDLPDDLAPARGGPSDVGSVLTTATNLVPEDRRRLHDLIRSLPLEHDEPPLSDWQESWMRLHSGPAAILVRLLRTRNIHSRPAQVLCLIGDGPYVSDSTIHLLGGGGVALTPRYVSAFAAVLGIPAEDLVAVTGVGPPEDSERLHPHRAELAALAWDARRLTSDQLSRVLRLADKLRRALHD